MADNPTPIRIVVKGEDGSGDEVFEGVSYEEVAGKLAEAKKHATRKIHELTEEKEALEAAVQPAPPLTQQPSDFDRQGYFNTLYTDPLKAFDQLVEKRFGMPPNQLVERMNYIEGVSNQSMQALITGTFANKHPELLQVPPEDDKHNGIVIAKILTERGWDYNLPNLEAAYAVAKADNALRFPKQDEAATSVPSSPAPGAPKVITRPSAGAGAASNDEQEFFNKASAAEIREYLEKKYASAVA